MTLAFAKELNLLIVLCARVGRTKKPPLHAVYQRGYSYQAAIC